METKTKMQQIEAEVLLLEEGDVMLVSAREVNGGKISLEFAGKVSGPNGLNLTALLNESDDRFNQTKPQRAYMSAEPKDVQRYLGINLDSIETEVIQTKKGDREVYPIGILNPSIAGRKINIQIQERLGLETDWEKENPEQAVKQDGNGNFLGKDGQPIIRKAVPVAGTPKNVFIQHDHAFPTLEALYDGDVSQSTNKGNTAHVVAEL